VEVDNAGSASLHGVDINATGGSTAVLVNFGGGNVTITEHGATRSAVHSAGFGIGINGGADSVVLVRNTDVVTSGSVTAAVQSFSGNGTATLTLDHATIEALGNDAMGLRVGQGTANLIDTDIVTRGDDTGIGHSPYAIYLAGAGATLNMTGGSAVTHGDEALTLGVGRRDPSRMPKI